MPQTDQLTALKVSRAKPKRRPDGTLIGYRLPDKKQTGLYLAVSATGAKSWVYMWERNGKRRVMGLGSEKALSLANAREDAAEAYRDVRKGLDPIAERNKRKGHSITFAEAAAACLKAKGVNWSAKHQRNFMPLLETHAKPLLTKAVNQITRDDVERVVRPIWTDKRKHDIASRLRGRIERVLDWAKANDHRTGENPAAWKGNLKHRLPEFERHVKHMAALRYKQIPEFMARLRMVDTRQARLLEFTILTAARSGETRGATWDEIDFDAKLWTIPESRMKAGPHQVPLSERAVEILKAEHAIQSSPYVFAGYKDGRPLGDLAMLKVLKKMGVDVVVHGFRSTFRDWCGDEMGTRFPREMFEFALAHDVGDATEQAYRRDRGLQQRFELMNAWAAYCEWPTQTDNVVSLGAKTIPA